MESGITLREGTYGFCSGPTYETRSEIAFFRQAGADAVGMSTVPEIIHGIRAGMEIIGISCITNKALTVPQPVSHADVTSVAAQVSTRFARLILAILSRL
jgi:purine-nucleoside phosphorylase